MKSMGKRGDSYAEAVSRVVEGLRGDAFIVAQELGREALSDPGAEGRPGTYESEAVEARPSGIEKLIEKDARQGFSFDSARGQRAIQAIYQTQRSTGQTIGRINDPVRLAARA